MSSASKLRPELPKLPAGFTKLPVDRGYPVPYFVTWLDSDGNATLPGRGKPDFRVISPRTVADCWKNGKCWLCGDKLGRYRAFVVGPMCAVNGISGEPPSHAICAKFAAAACPFLSRPHAKRRDVGLPHGASEENVAGTMLRCNPGVTLIWVTTKPGVIFDNRGLPLFTIGELHALQWIKEGRPATRDEVWQSIESGLPALEELCETDRERSEVKSKVEYVETIMPNIAYASLPMEEKVG